MAYRLDYAIEVIDAPGLSRVAFVSRRKQTIFLGRAEEPVMLRHAIHELAEIILATDGALAPLCVPHPPYTRHLIASAVA